MTTLDRLNQWHKTGVLAESQHAAIVALVRKQRFSLFVEVNALLYLGVVSLAVGLGWTFKTYFTNLGDAFILTTLSAMLVGSLYCCFSRGRTYSNEAVESPTLVFDYVLYFSCLVLAVEIGYIEFRFQVLQNAWDQYLLLSAIVFFFLAYRFDNRFVLSLAMSTLAGWFGLKVSHFSFASSDGLWLSAFVYSAILVSTGTALYRAGIKKHFLETYLHIASNVLMAAALSGINRTTNANFYFVLLLAFVAAAMILGFRFRRFAFVVYGTIYGYIGISSKVLPSISGETAVLTYFVVTGTIVIVSMAVLARRFGREA